MTSGNHVTSHPRSSGRLDSRSDGHGRSAAVRPALDRDFYKQRNTV